VTGLNDEEREILRRFDPIEARTARAVDLPIKAFRWLVRHHYLAVASGPHPLRFRLTLRGENAINKVVTPQ
jgi:hypothetical protein